ncbi:ester cyclase [Spartinivicinus poritis]|uniref:Ester cyclase n=1 Tax=Spartinivicinus poritis TaxID=2994640 RepID=A0ABT5UGK1_9GAMM|nr:ester cyclase [Spartinivicinus sp. A2-2]MDE1465521.1 ester cyclase [Spartinivicinus sp. A2-2]
MNCKQGAIARDLMGYIWNDKEVDCISEYMNEQTIIESPVRISTGTEGFNKILQIWFRAFPTLRYTEDELFILGNTATLKWRVSGQHLGEFYSIAPTGKEIHYDGTTQFAFNNGVVSSYNATVNIQDIITQIASTTVEIVTNKNLDTMFDTVRQQLGNITDREIAFLALACLNLSSKQVGDLLSVKGDSAAKMITAICQKIGINNRGELTDFAVEKNAYELLHRLGVLFRTSAK